MNCVITGVSISNDVDNRLTKTVATVAKTDNTKANILSALLNNDANVEFKWYLWNHLTENDFLKDSNVNINDLTAFTNKDYVNIKQNKLAKLLNDFYEYKYPSINNSKTNKAEGSLNGFLTGSAKSLAKTETAKLIIEEYGKDMFLPKNKRRDRYVILREVNKRILNEFYNRVNNYIAEINNPDNTNYNKNAAEDINKYLNILDRIKELKFQRSSLNATITELKNNRSDLIARRGQLNALNKTASVEEQAVNNATIADINTELNQIEIRLKESNDSLDTLKNPIAQLNYVKYVLANNIVNDHINSYIGVQKNRLINYRNLVEQTRNNADNWYNQVYHHKTMTDIVKSMELTENLDQYLAGVDTNEDELIDTNNAQNIDETTKNWEDHLYKSFDNAVSGKLKLLIAQLDNLSQPFNENAELQAIDTNNELGVSTKMNVQKVINNIFSFADYSNIDNFINSIEEKSKNVKALYGLGSLVKTMKERRDIANFVFVNFAKPVVHKVILNVQNIANRENISLDYSNNSAFNTTATIFNLANKLRLTYNEVYNDKHDKNIRQLFKDFNDNKISNTNFIKSLQDFLNIYFPNINKDTISNTIISIINDKNSKDKLHGLERTIQGLLTNIKEMKVKINEQLQAIDNFNREKDIDNNRKIQEIIERARIINPNISNNELNEYVKKEISNRKDIDTNYKDTNDIDFSISSATYSSIYNLVNFLSNFNESSARLNTANAEGHSASDVIKNNWITRFFDQLQDETGKGLEVLRDYFTQGINEHGYNQYSNNPLLFGVKDGNGVIIHNGLFNPTNGGFDINKYAAQIIRYSLFDGSKNTSNNDGKGYSKMSKLDFFITQFEAFVKGIPEFTNNGYLSKIQDTDNAVYSMRIGSDAPKIFFIRAPKYNNTDVRRAIYGHVLDEINMFINGLDRIFVQEGKVLVPRKNVTNLYGRLYYDEKKATKLIQDGKTDLTEAITDGKRLYGNAFKFNRLFKVLDAETKGEKYYDAGEEIEAALSLYGGGNTTALFSTDNNGRLVLTPNDVIRYEDGHFVLHLGNEQKKMIMNTINKWANNYLWECKNRLNEFMNVFNNIGIEYNEEEINSFLLNTANMNMNYDDLFEGDFKYYNNARDFLKRTKESQAGGEGYAAYNSQVLETEILNNKIQDGTNQTEEVIKIKTKASDENGKDVYEPLVINGKQIVARNGFRGVTIYNTVKVSDYADEMQKSLYNDFIKNGMSEQVAYDKSVAIAAGYGHNQGEKTKINDAQSYITFEEFIRRRYADGSISEYYDLINQLLDDNVKVEDINIDDINARIQVGKNFYFDKPYDSRTGTFAPRQIKNAEFVLIPKLLPKDSELIKVYNWMMKNDIGQLNTAETSKAAKKNIFTIWDGKTGEFNKNFEETFTNDYVENYYYQYLYKQQDVPQHLVDEENKAGSQIMKKILDNIINNSDNSEHRKELVQWGKDFQNAYTANIQEKFNDFIDSMGWKYNAETKKIVNADGSEKLNYDKFYSRAREEASRLGMDSNFFDYITTDDFGNPIMPNCMNINMNKLESIAQACYNGTITRQTLPGWHAAQITAVGYSRKLKFDVKTGTMEVYLPRWSSKIPKYNPNDTVHQKMVEDAKRNKEYADLTNYEIFDKLIIKQIESEGLDLHIGYRIPTEGKQSVAILKVVGFTNDCLGSTIVVPDEWVTQTGSDFDVDSVYGISWELYTKKDKHGRITLHKVEYERDKMDTKQMYLEYIKHKADVKAEKVDISEELAEEKNTLFKNMKDEESAKRNKDFKELDDKRQNAFGILPRKIQQVIIKTNAKREFKDNGKVNIVKLYTTLKDNLIKTVENPDIKQILTEEDIEHINEYCDYLKAIVDFVNDVQSTELVDITEFRSKKANIISNLLNKAKETRFETAEQEAVNEGEISYDEFLKLPFEQQLSRRSRNNLILDRMMKIMQDFSSREEQLGRSNFDKITNGKDGANDIIDKISGKTSKPQSPYNVLDQLDYFEDAMGGARLKALSVTADTFVSKNNKIRAKLSSDIVKVLIENDVEDSVIHYNIDDIIDSYDEDVSEYVYNTSKNRLNRKEMLNKMYMDADAFAGEVSQSIYTKQNNKFVLKTNTEVEQMISAISKRGVPKNRINDLLSEESIKYLTEDKDNTNYYNIGYTSGEPEILAVTNRELFDENYTPKTILYLRDKDRLNKPVSPKDIAQFKNTSTFLVDALDKIAVEFFKQNGYKYKIYKSTNDNIDSNNTNLKQFTIIPLHDADKKAAIKASMANKYIGFANGINGSSTANYAEQAKKQNIPVNSNDYNNNDIIFVSIPGRRGDINIRKQQQDITIKEAIKALNAGATILTDTKNYTDNSTYNEGEKRLKSNLEYLGFKYTEINGVGVWNKNGDFSKINKNKTNKYNRKDKSKKILFTARRLGWSNNNHNIVGEYVTTYTSQTTAHHLDAVKMGSVPNVNEYTFFTYKLLSMLGIDYENTIAFMRQPVITQLVMNNNLINSVFFKNTALDPIGMTFNSIAQKLNLGYIKNKKVRAIKNDTRINDTINAFINNSDFVDAFYDIYGIDISEIESLKDLREITVPLSKSQMFERIKDKDEYNVYQAAIDFAMLTNFMNYKRISDNINNLMRATNVDKNGALQSIRENRKAIELIEKLRNDTTLMRGEQSFINSIFTPNIANSEYKSIDAIYQYVTLASNNTNENLFMLETADFDALTKRVEETIGRRLTENEYKEYKRFLMNYIYNSEDSVLLAPITIDIIGRVRKDTQAQSNNTYWNAERSRIFGFGRRFSESFDIEDINNPTKEDIAKFKRLSPAQKTLFIQKHFTENTGIFNYLNVTLYNKNDITYKGINRHYLSYNDQISDIEDLYHLFNMSYFNHNPLIKLAAIDLVKYAFIAEGFNFKSNYISKIIPNTVLYSETNDGGLDIISKIINDVHAFTNKMNDINEYDKFVNTFMRSHSNMIKEVTYNTESDSSFISNLATYTRQDRMIVIDASIDNWAIKKFIANTRANTNGYIKINYQNPKTIISRLYKIAGYGKTENGYKVYYFIPLNKLDSYESYDVSYNQNYNQVNDISYYYEVIRELNQGERAKTIIQPVGKFKYEFNNTIQDYQLINYLQEQEDIYLKGGVDKLISDISRIYNSELFTENEANYIINNNRQLRNYITNKTTQLIEVNNTVMAVEITPVKVTPKLASWIRYNIKLKNSGKDYDSKYLSIISDIENSQDIIDKSIIYKITKAKIDTETANKNIMDANTDLLIDTDENSLDVLPRRDVDIVSSSIINEIRYMARKYSSPIANSFMNTINRNKIDIESRESLKENREDIYRAAARYYKSAANGIINRLNKFNIEGVDYSMDSDKFYEVLKEHDELFPTVAKILLDGVTFGNRIIDIFSLDLTTDNLDTKNDIESIINSINSVRQNKKLADGMKKIFNIYMAKYSTNPAIVDNIMQLREAFGDLGTIDSWFADPTDIANPQVQVVLKHVMGTFSKAELFDAKQNVENWKKEVADIEKEPGELDYNKFIDSENGRIRDDFNQKFLEDRQKVIDDLNEARKHKYESVQKFREYLEASLARDKFYYENTNQRIVDDYYKEDIAAREEVLKNAGDYYVQFAMLASQLNNSDIEITETEEETKKRKSEIKQKMQWLRNTGSEEKSKEAKTAAAYINLYYQERIKRYEKYFDRQEYEGFAEDYERYKNFINAYNDKHPEYSLEEKLQNTTYREAYDWIRTNGRISFGKEGDDKVKQAFKILTNRSSRIDKSRIIGLRNIGADVFDEYGRLDPRKLTEKQLALFKSDEEQAITNMYNDGLGESILIKDVRVKRPLGYPIKHKKAPSETTKRKWEINQKINSILSKCVDKNTGKLDYSMLFNDNIVTDEDRVALIKYYNELRTIQLNYDHKFENKFVTEAIDDAAYNDAMNYYRTKLMNTKQGAQFIEIIHEKNAEGKYVPNYNLFGYIDILDVSLIDEDRTAARNFINDNIEFETTEYYEEAKKAALSQGKEAYDKWFNANHIYDSFTHRYKPLNIWTEMRAIPGSSLDAGVEYIATGQNVESSVKEEYINKNYKELTNNYKKGNPKYDSNIKLSDKERKMRDLWVETLNKYATTYQGRQFVNKGYLPRERKQQVNALWAAEQVGGLFGISIRSGAESDTFKDEVDYSHDKEAEMKMLTLIKAKGTREYIPLPQRGSMKEEEYKKKLEDVRKQNEEIKKQNEIIDKANINRDWKEVMEHFVHNATIFNSRQNAKPYLYLLLEDLRKNRAYMTKGIFNKRLSKDAERSTKDDTIYRTTEQKNTADLLHNFTRRILFEQYHENNIQRRVANFLQNLTSAKYMVFNVYGGIANVATGEVNIAMEAFAKEYFSFKDLANAKAQYVKALPNIIAKLYSEDSLDITSAFIKDFNIVDFDEILQYGEGSNNLDKYLKRARNFTYSLQSMGEHYMQNTVLLAMLKSNRLYQDSEGTMRIGDFKDYSRDIEKKAMQEVLSKYNGLLKHYNLYRDNLKYDIKGKYDIITGRKDINRNFLNSIKLANRELYKQIAKEYHKKRKNMLKDANAEFNKNKTVESLYTFDNGHIKLTDEAINYFNEKVGENKINTIGSLEQLIGEFREKVIQVNKKIHGVYDKNGAAKIEKEWWGSIVMQYHKHLYPGIMKRWRRKGYYSETRGSNERGANQDLIDFLCTEFVDLNSISKEKAKNNNTNIVLASIQTAMLAGIDSIQNMMFNWDNLSEDERANIRRTFAENAAILSAVLFVMVIYAAWDDDDIRNNGFVASLLYSSDRLYSDSTMYNPMGITSEIKTTWSSPVASATGPSDFITACNLIASALFDPDFNPEYQTGQYAHKNKFEVLLRRNIPGLRPYDRIQLITRNNQYYKIGESQIGINIGRKLGEALRD